MKFIVAFTLFFAAVLGSLTEQEYRQQFTSWMQKYQKSYHHDEFAQRYLVFKANLDWINSFEAEKRTFTVGMNKFGDLTNEEFSRLFNGLKMPEVLPLATFQADPQAQLPTSLDWRDKGAVTPIKNQGQCGSCWSFSTTGSTEGCHQITTGTLVGLSEQNLMDCSTSYGNEGCNGGLMTQAMQYIIDNKGVDTEASYPYTAEDGSCNFQASNVGATLKSYQNVASGDENALQQSVNSGPTSVAIDASQSSFQFYTSGVYYEPQCSSQQLDHGVLAVGWGVDSSSGDAYWIVKNSWGTDWGIEGYIWMSRNRNNNCGIATMATLPQC